MENKPTLNPLVNTPLTELDRVVDSPRVLLPSLEQNGMGAKEPILFSVFHIPLRHIIVNA